MTTATGIISWQAQASAFGDTKIDMQIASTRLAAENNHRFPGQYYDAETGLHQNYFRDYEASIGRYVQRDPIGLDGGINVFGYVGGRLVGGVDPLIICWYWGCKGDADNPALPGAPEKPKVKCTLRCVDFSVSYAACHACCSTVSGSLRSGGTSNCIIQCQDRWIYPPRGNGDGDDSAAAPNNCGNA